MISTLKKSFSLAKLLPVKGSLNTRLIAVPSKNAIFYSKTLNPVFTGTFGFCSSPKDPQNSTQQQSQTKTHQINGLTMDEFVAFMTDKDTGLAGTNYNYNSKIIYALTDNLKTKPQVSKNTFVYKGYWYSVYLFEVLLWSPICYLAYVKINPYATLIPLLCSLLTLTWTRISQSRIDNTVMRLELVNEEQVIIYLWSHQGEGIACKIQGASIQNIAKGENKQKDSKVPETVAIYTEFFESRLNPRKIQAIFRVAPGDSPIENLELFKCILQGKTSEISKFMDTHGAN